ncbi:lipopolysaccharide assembly protein LapB [Paenacidovorax monticola]|uniref:Lipopolysaccharide assembly protein B n=1 Tax=Paenacidovorax monticola TaxID=1926868 RepID=A0A7H0HJ33_9BURK|nr:lipopolysaccharide assembly protein LapB [Paenacidovorax monticola]QNP60549.1 lipopolysaccharide assembly protein LapB [Paenacidovorax monticola]
MEFDLSWILLGLPLAFVLGWLASRFDLRQLRAENRQAPKAYFKGLNFLLNEQQDKAIDAFIEAVQNDPDTSELHFALGNLFRRRGEYNRAVRVHEHLLSRGDLGPADRDRAQHALALDFLKAGLLDRAEEALKPLEGTAFESEARLALLAIYERSRDWPQAAAITRKMQASGQGDFSARQAHYLCEQATAASAQGDEATAHTRLTEAMAAAPQAPRPRIELARQQHRQGQPGAAVDTLATLAAQAPGALPLATPLLIEAAAAAGRSAEALALLGRHYEQMPSLDLLEGLVALDRASGDATRPGRNRYVEHLAKEPSLVAATQWLATEQLEHEQFHPQIQRALDQAARPLMRYRCAACGFEARQHFWQCPGCQTWDSYPARRVEEL